MLSLLGRYVRWLHTGWPAGLVEKLPLVEPDGSTNVPGLYIAGDLGGIPLLKFSSDTGARTVRTIAADLSAREGPRDQAGSDRPLDLVIIGAGVAGMAAALEARAQGLTFEIIEASEPLSTLVNFPKGKPIYTYPTGMTPAGALQFSSRSAFKEGLVEEVKELTLGRGIAPRIAPVERVERRGAVLETVLGNGERVRSRRVLVTIGRSGEFRKLGVPGEDLDKVYNRLHDPADFADRRIMVIGGGDSALESAIAIARAGGAVTLSYRRPELSRPKPDNVEMLNTLRTEGPVAAPGSVRLALGSRVREIRPSEVVLDHEDGRRETVENDAVFTMLGREAPLPFLRNSGVRIRGDWTMTSIAAFVSFLAFCVFLYNWKAGARLYGYFQERNWFPFNIPEAMAAAGGRFGAWSSDAAHPVGTLALSLGSPAFYYSLAYTVCVVLFGIARIRRRRTPYITLQTITLIAVQVIPLFLLPYLVLPWAGHNGWFDSGAGGWLADNLFPRTEWDPQGREYWRAFGLVLAWPLFIWNMFTSQPMWLWLGISVAQTFVLIPVMIYFWGKGSYCGWICSCGALAETLGDTHRHKMPHGPFWNRLNLVGQVVLAAAFILLGSRVLGWIWPDSAAATFHAGLLNGWRIGTDAWHIQMNYYWWVDVMMAGILGVGCYFWLSGRVWCRFACPLAALMHIYARFSRFRILAEKKKCISCNICTSVCHQGIDVMSFANKGQPMADPECVRCSACVQSCPTGVLSFGQVNPSTLLVIRTDRLAASPVRMTETGQS